MGSQAGVCPHCESVGEIGQLCSQRVCHQNGYHHIPVSYNEAIKQLRYVDRDRQIGVKIGDYLLVESLGAGGFGRVYLGLQLPVMLKAAVKLTLPGSGDAAAVEWRLKKFESEGRSLAQLAHPNIVRLLKYGTYVDMPYLVVEYVENGRTLKQQIEEQRRVREPDLQRTRHILTQLLNGLDAAHERKIVHRDIKPGNIMLQSVAGDDHFVRILDFGLAKLLMEGQAQTSRMAGTPNYMAPEQISGDNLGPWTDLYAVGVVAFEMITGRLPFRSRKLDELLIKKLDPTFDPLADLPAGRYPPEVLGFFSKALNRHPVRRFQNAGRFIQGLDRALEALERQRAVGDSSESRRTIEVSDDTPTASLKPRSPRLTNTGPSTFWKRAGLLGSTLILSPGALARRIRDWVFPAQPEPVPRGRWDVGFKARLLLLPFLATLNVLGRFFSYGDPNFNRQAYDLALVFNLPGHAIAVSLCIWALVSKPEARICRWITAVCCFLELYTGTVGLWITGSVTSVFNILWYVIAIAVYRVYFDWRMGAVAFFSAVGLHSGLVLLELFGITRSGIPLGAQVEISQMRLAGFLVWHLVGYSLVWVMASMVARRNVEFQQVRRHLARVVAGEQPARLAGVILARRFELIHLVGRGGMGEVYRARRLSDGADLAVKVLHPFQSGDPKMLQRFEREAEVAARVAADYVPQIFEVGTTEEGQHYIVMEFLRGEDLAAFLKRRRQLPAQEAAELISALGRALAAVHETGAIHRDLKPSNIFLIDHHDAGFVPKLLDFGISKLQDEAATLTQTGAVLGSPGFMAPEVARGDAKRVDRRADIFALGAIAYQLLTGRRPFPAQDLVLYISEVLFCEPPPATRLNPELPEAIDLVLLKALAKDPDQRYDDAPGFVADLRTALSVDR